MRTFLYHRLCPEGKIFDPEGREAPFPPPKSEGWIEERGLLGLTDFERGQQMVENAVRAELERDAKAGRDKLDAEHKQKYGFEPPTRATMEQVANIMDNKTLNGEMTRPTLRAKSISKHFTRKEDR